MGIADRLRGYGAKVKASYQANRDQARELKEIREAETWKARKQHEKDKVKIKYQGKRKRQKDKQFKLGSGDNFLFGTNLTNTKKGKKGKKGQKAPRDPMDIFSGGGHVGSYIGSSGGKNPIFGQGEVNSFLHGKKRK